MAHKGKYGPVVFRRDFSLNVNRYDDGWANRYLVTPFKLPAGPGAGLVGKEFDCGPGTYNGLNSLFWTSDPEIIAGFVWIIEVRCTVVNGWQFDKEFLVFIAPNTLALQMICANDPAPWGPNFPFDATWTVVFRDPLFFGPGDPDDGINAISKLWTDGPPH